LRLVSVDSVRHVPDGPGAEVYTERLQKSMTPYITTQVSYRTALHFCLFVKLHSLLLFIIMLIIIKSTCVILARVHSRRQHFSCWHYSVVGGLFTGQHISTTTSTARQSEMSPSWCNTIR